ncbi:hypothetical protein RFI_27669 [Reticulomyxa filosa]|uniref:Uncharacterized protein n=1 Tax=Reticulomyxa filosa TaxID=46433 RepID=X6M8B5_RETFI|nr:hypothetical protein RFI_27669 [Reticulomyxa filosa]|eukprot:ETO09712.1 hypothetical protein RFI_27669 [Reticulomyxa filosa]
MNPAFCEIIAKSYYPFYLITKNKTGTTKYLVNCQANKVQSTGGEMSFAANLKAVEKYHDGYFRRRKRFFSALQSSASARSSKRRLNDNRAVYVNKDSPEMEELCNRCEQALKYAVEVQRYVGYCTQFLLSKMDTVVNKKTEEYRREKELKEQMFCKKKKKKNVIYLSINVNIKIKI